MRGVAGLDQNGNALGTGNRGLEQFQLLRDSVLLLRGQAGNVPAGVRARLATSPLPTGSFIAVTTIGIVAVACLAANAAAADPTTMTSGASGTSSAARSGSRSDSPSAQRLSISMSRST